MTEIKGLVSMGVQGVMDALGPSFERTTGERLALTFNTSKMLLQALRGGADADVVIGAREGIDGLIVDGLVVGASAATLCRSVVGVAVKAGAPKPDISTADALKQAVLAARAIGYSDPAGGGASGVHFANVIERLGIAVAMQPKIRLARGGTHSADLLLTGEVDLAVQQVAELIYVQGIELVGPLPAELQLVTTFVGAIHAKAEQPDAAKALLDFLRSPEGASVIKAQGMEPA